MNKLYYICYGSMFLKYISVDLYAYKNDFVDNVSFSYNSSYCDTFSFDYANKLIEVLVKIGFDKEKLFLREDNKEESDKDDRDSNNNDN